MTVQQNNYLPEMLTRVLPYSECGQVMYSTTHKLEHEGRCDHCLNVLMYKNRGNVETQDTLYLKAFPVHANEYAAQLYYIAPNRSAVEMITRIALRLKLHAIYAGRGKTEQCEMCRTERMA